MDATEQSHGEYSWAVQKCQWNRVRELVDHGVTLEQRDVALSQAVTHSQWWLVSRLVQLGVSQQQRDLAVHKAVRYRRCDVVIVLLSAGVSYEQRDFVLLRALHHQLWGLVSRLLTQGVELQRRNLVVTEALGQGQWEVVSVAVSLGVRPELVAEVFQEIVSQRQWAHVPILMASKYNNKYMDFVLRAAISDCQWGCVRLLVKVGLTPDQQNLVCSEALEQAHFKCAMELLRQGCHPQCAERIVLEAFNRNRCQDLVQVLREDGIPSNIRDLAVGMAKGCEWWDKYLMIVEVIGVGENEMTQAITTAIHTISIALILHLISLFACSRRVFKQVLLKTRFFTGDIIVLSTLLLDEHPDLVFHMFVAQGMWGNVVCMFEDSRVSPRSRSAALRQAVAKHAWEFVVKMVSNPSANHRDRRHAFLQAARQGQWQLALTLSTQSIRISKSDKLFAFRTWLRLGLWDCVNSVLKYWNGSAGTESFVRCILEESVKSDDLEHFFQACSKCYFEDKDIHFALDTAMKHNKCNFVLEFCRHNKSFAKFKAALELAIENKKWIIVGELMGNTNEYLHSQLLDDDIKFDLFLMCLKGILPVEGSWQTVVPVLDAFCMGLDLYDPCDFDFSTVTEFDSTQALSDLTEWCVTSACASAGLLFSVILSDENQCTRLVDRQRNEINSNVFRLCFALAVKKSAWGLAATCLQHLSVYSAESIVTDMEDEFEFTDLMQKYKEREQYEWVIYIGVFTRDWTNVTANLPLCQNSSVVDYVIEKAVRADKWDIVQNLIPRCSQDSEILVEILGSAIFKGQFEVAAILILKVDPTQVRGCSSSLMYKAVTGCTSLGDREEMVRLCIASGLSTHFESCNCAAVFGYSTAFFTSTFICMYSPMKTVLTDGQLPIVKLLHKAGACSNQVLFLLKQDLVLKSRLQSQGRHDIVQYLEQAATTPRTLQDLCRLQVSHYIGCRPGRLERVMSLGMSWPARALINFDDVLMD